MADNNIILIALHSGNWLSLWQCYAGKTEGDAFEINADGTVPEGTDIATFVADLIEDQFEQHIDELTLQVCTEGYEDWLVSVDPASYTIDLDEPQDLEFVIQICVPEGTEPGEYCFDICAIGDGVAYARQQVCVRVPIEVPVDIKPTSCPNPLNTSGRGGLPVAILGTMDFDVTQIDPASITLEGISPSRWDLEDVATPFEPFMDKEDCFEDCTEEGPDGYMDLTLKFSTQEVVAALGDVSDGDCLVLMLAGDLKEEFGGTAIIGEDVVMVVVKK
jgi:hypothetical protein